MVRLPPRLRPLFPLAKPAYTALTRAVAPVTVRRAARRGQWVPTAATTLAAVGTRPDGRYVVGRPAETVKRGAPIGSPPEHPAFIELETEVDPALRVAEFPRGRVLGRHHAVITARNELVHDVCYYFGTTRPTEHPLYWRADPGPPHHVEGRLGVLASRNAGNYYHFLFDVIARLGVAEACAGIEAPHRWYVPAALGFQVEMLERLGIDRTRRVDAAEFPHVVADSLVVPSVPAISGHRPAWIVRFLRERLLDSDRTVVTGRRIYVTRGQLASNRRVLNEDALIEFLTARGFEALDLADMTVDEQIATFASAEYIVAAHGAGLANLVFASPGAHVVELFPGGTVIADYWKIASAVPGVTYRYLCEPRRAPLAGLIGAEHARRLMLVRDMTVDLAELGRLLDM